MKIISFLAAAALAGIGVSTLAVAFGFHAMGTFSLAMIPLILVGFIRDYAPRQSRWEPSRPPASFTLAQTRHSGHARKLAA